MEENRQMSTTVREPVWYIKSRATDRVTTDLSQLFVNASYTGQDQTQVGNCERLNISHTGFTSLPSALKSMFFYLKNVLGVPHISKNLLRISKFTKDNNCVVEFLADHYMIKDKVTKIVLLQGELKVGLYQLKIPSISSSCSSFYYPY
ncbi:uncharacterized protein LOC116112044 isoform X2 [Pistacia vera]|uniref:uncharacterized protein LOC116112044 isoform X2 n=1 Tax=Pistacia vera TaxID=55513 RepID=UPI0012630737|nr:uncharacterized protein LOC116112044 isoform X2 [Pistacia vera]